MIYHYLINTPSFVIGWRWCPGSVWWVGRRWGAVVVELGRIQIVIYY